MLHNHIPECRGMNHPSFGFIDDELKVLLRDIRSRMDGVMQGVKILPQVFLEFKTGTSGSFPVPCIEIGMIEIVHAERFVK